MTKTLSNHWADIAAARIINQRGQQSLYTLASGITPSGGTYRKFQRVITVDLVARSLRKLGKKLGLYIVGTTLILLERFKIFQILKRWKNI